MVDLLENIFSKEMFNEKTNSNMEIKVGDKSTIESEQGQIISHRANIKSVSLFIHLEGVEDDRE